MRNIKDIHGWITVRDAAGACGVSVDMVLSMIVGSRIRQRRIGSERLVYLEEVRAEVSRLRRRR